MGNVLVDYRPMEYTQRFFSDPAEATLVCRELFDGPEWPLLDEGKIEPEVALAQVCGRKRAIPPLVRSIDDHP